MRRILVTGANGFVGRHLVPALNRSLASGDHILGIGRGDGSLIAKEAEYRQLDLLDAEATRALIADYRPTDVLHLAAVASVQVANGSPAETWNVNFNGTFNLAQALARQVEGGRFYFVSSSEVYGRSFKIGTALGETAVPEPASAYGRSKLATEFMLNDVLGADIKLVVFRPFNHTGPGQDERFVVPSFAGQIARLELGGRDPFIEVGDLSAQRDFLDVRDVVEAYRQVVFSPVPPPHRALYNICSEKPRKIAEILETLRQYAKVQFEIRVMSERLRPSEIPIAWGDHSAITQMFGWRPQTDFSETLRLILDDARTIQAVRTARKLQ
jgi:GDP-4-dehydro-6-deoxy-D-mannose reductase